jgi:hypothetical protein
MRTIALFSAGALLLIAGISLYRQVKELRELEAFSNESEWKPL